MPLALAAGDSQVTLRGGTQVPFSPPFSYIEQVYLPIVSRMGLQASVKLNAWGWYPQGRGEVHLRVTGDAKLGGINLLDRGKLREVRGLAVVTELPAHIANRMALRSENILRQANLRNNIKPLRATAASTGAGIFLTAEYEHSLAGFSALGRLGLPAEKVAEKACKELLDFQEKVAPVDVHLADQLLLPSALAAEKSAYRVAEISSHLTTNIWVIQQFGLASINIDEIERIIAIAPKINI